MKIIIISGFFYPQNTPRAFRTTELVKEFVRLGHNVTLFVPEMEYNLSDFLRTFPITVKYYQEMPERRKTGAGSTAQPYASAPPAIYGRGRNARCGGLLCEDT